MHWILAFHIISMVAWFAGLFYLPRLFLYHALSQDTLSIERFKIMENKLYFMITTPAAVLTTVLGICLLSPHWQWYRTQNWMLTKLSLVGILWLYHLYCAYLLNRFKHDSNRFSPTFYRWFNEIPTILLILIVILVIVRPF